MTHWALSCNPALVFATEAERCHKSYESYGRVGAGHDDTAPPTVALWVRHHTPTGVSQSRCRPRSKQGVGLGQNRESASVKTGSRPGSKQGVGLGQNRESAWVKIGSRPRSKQGVGLGQIRESAWVKIGSRPRSKQGVGLGQRLPSLSFAHAGWNAEATVKSGYV